MKIKLHFSWWKLLSTAMVIAGLTMASSTFAQVKLWFDTPSTLSALPSWGQYTNNPTVTQTPSRNTFCWYPTRVVVNSSGYQVWSTDAKFFASGLNLTGFLTGTSFVDYFSQQANPYLPLTGSTAGAQQNASTIAGLYNYPTASSYYYINATVGFGNTGVVQASGLTLGTMWYRTNAQTVSTGELVFYWVSTTGDSTNMQSGSTNTFINIVRSLTWDLRHTTGMTFQTWPCILDVDAPLFTGQQSGQTLNYFLDTFSVVTYDWTGSRIYTYTTNTNVSNSTIHYYFNGSNYVAVTTNDIDNQNGISTGSITLNISGTTYAVNAWTGEAGMNAFFNGTTGALITLNLTATGFTSSNTGVLGSGMLWTGGTLNARWRGALLSSILSGGALSGIRENQVIRVVFTGADRPNQSGATNTGNLIYTFTITGFDNIPPYLTTGNYQSTGNNGTTLLGTDGLFTRGAGDRFTTAQVTGWTQWTSGNVNLLITGSEVFQILTSTITGAGHGYLTSLNLTINNNAFTIAKILTFTGNYISGSFQFIDNPLYSGTIAEGGSNTGITITSGSANYAKQFAFDVFWIDQAIPALTSGYTNNSAQNSVPINTNNVRVTLTWSNTGLINYNATAVTTDDEFVILGLSGKNGFPSNPSYAKYDYAGGMTSGTFALVHSGLVFEQGWEGCVLVRDRAGNSVCHDIKIDLNQFTMELRAVLAQRLDSNIYSWTGITRFYQYSGTSFTGALTTTGLNITGNTAGTGTWTININNAAATGYLVLLKTQSHLSVGYSGYLNWSTLTQTGKIFDFSFTGNYQPWSSNATGYLRQFNLSAGVPTYAASKDAMYLVPGDVNWNDIIGATDLVIINSGLTVSLTSPSPANDFDADGFVTSRDQAILIENSSKNGFWRTFNGGFTGAVAPDATPSTSGFWFGNGTF